MKNLLLGALLFFSSLLHAEFPSNLGAQILYLIHQGEVQKGFSLYLDHSKLTSSHDFELLQQAALTLLESGSCQNDPEIQMLCIFGAGISMHKGLLPILEKGIKSKELRSQLAAIHYLDKFQDDYADELIHEALSSPFLIARLEAAYSLAKKKDSSVIEAIQSLLLKIPPLAKALLAQVLAPLESPAATVILRQFLLDSDIHVRCQTILQAGMNGLDDLLPAIKALSTHPDPMQKECCALALAAFKDEESIPLLKKWTASTHPMIRLAAAKGLCLFECPDGFEVLKQEAKQRNPYAIFLLSEVNDAINLLKELAEDTELTVRINAAMSLLKKKIPISDGLLKECLVTDQKDLGFLATNSPSGSLSCWKGVANAAQKKAIHPRIESQTHVFKAEILRLCLELPEENFLKAAKIVIDYQQAELIPLLIDLMVNHQSPKSIEFLKEQQQKTGAPLIRQFCTLALYKLNEPGNYEEQIFKWVASQENNSIIRFKEEEFSEKRGDFILSPEETSQLLILSFEVLASAQNQTGIEALVHAIAYGNAKNRYALAGLLMRTSE